MQEITQPIARPAHSERMPRRRGAPDWWRRAAGAAVWSSIVVVLALWVSGQGVQQLGTSATLLSSVGRLTGLASSDLLLIQVLLVARIPWVERSFGQDELVHRHRLVGFTSFSLMVAHVVLISVGYATADQTGVLAEVWEIVTTYPGMLLATAGTALLAMVVITSVKAARRRLRYESWHLLHLYAYLGVGLALPHQIWAGSDFIDSWFASVYWWSTFIAAAGAVLVFRLGLPSWRNWRHQLVVDRVVPEGRGVVSIYMRGRNLHRLPAEAGQFFVWRFLHGSGWTRGNPFSLSAAPNGQLLRITAKDLGTGSRRLASLPVGTRVVFEGPFGRLTDSARRTRKMTMIASGIGITPLRALLEEADYRPGQAVLLYRAGAPTDFLFRHELEALAVHRGVRVVYLPGQRMRDRRSWVPQRYAARTNGNVLRDLVPDIDEHDVFICGPSRWTEVVIASARRAGVPPEQMHTERFGW